MTRSAPLTHAVLLLTDRDNSWTVDSKLILVDSQVSRSARQVACSALSGMNCVVSSRYNRAHCVLDKKRALVRAAGARASRGGFPTLDNSGLVQAASMVQQLVPLGVRPLGKHGAPGRVCALLAWQTCQGFLTTWCPLVLDLLCMGTIQFTDALILRCSSGEVLSHGQHGLGLRFRWRRVRFLWREQLVCLDGLREAVARRIPSPRGTGAQIRADGQDAHCAARCRDRWAPIQHELYKLPCASC